MADDDRLLRVKVDGAPGTQVSVEVNLWPLVGVLALIFFWGSPNLLDSLIHYLQAH